MPRVHYKIRSGSAAPFLASVFTLFAFVLLLFIFWPLFSNWYSGGIIDPGIGTKIAAIVYGVYIAAMFLFVLFTGPFASRTLKLSALISIPIFLFYFIEVSGIKSSALFFDLDNVLFYYREAPLFRGWWIFVAALSVAILLAMSGYVRLAFHRAASPLFPVLMMWLSALGWIFYGIAHIIGYEYVYYQTGLFSQTDFLYSLLNYLASLLFFVSLLLLVTSLRKTMTAGDSPQPVATEYNTIPAKYPATPVLSEPLPQSAEAVIPVVEPVAEPQLLPAETAAPDADETPAAVIPEVVVDSAAEPAQPEEVLEATIAENASSTAPPKKPGRKRKAEINSVLEDVAVPAETFSEPEPEKPRRARKKKLAETSESQ